MVEIPIGRLGKPEEIAETVVWMVKTGYVNNKVGFRHRSRELRLANSDC